MEIFEVGKKKKPRLFHGAYNKENTTNKWLRADQAVGLGGSRDYAPMGMYEEEKSLSCVQLFGIPWTVAHQASQSMGFSRHEYWSGLPFPSPGDLPDPGIEPGSSAL